MENIQSNKSKTYLVGIGILRFYLALMVIYHHFGGEPLLKPLGLFYLFAGFHVPTFMLLSFTLCGSYFLEPTKEKVLKRVLRIVIPFLVWGVVAFLALLVFWKMDFTTLLWQLGTGIGVNSSLWYLYISLIISALFWLIRAISNKKVFLVVITLLAVVCLVFQYTGLNTYVFSNTPYQIQNSLGRLCEMIPYASLGIGFSIFLPKLKNISKSTTAIIFVITFTMLIVLAIFASTFYKIEPNGYGYSGLYDVLMGFGLVVTAFTNPLNFIENERFKNITKVFTSFTLGIYAMNSFMGLFVEYFFNNLGWATKNIFVVVVTYLVSYLICFLINLIPNKYTKMTVN